MIYLCGFIILAVGLALCTGGALAIRHANEFARSAHRTTGSVIGIRERQSSTNGSSFGGGIGMDGTGIADGMRTSMTLYFPIVRFQTDDGRVVETETMYGSSIRSAKVGEAVVILFDPADPTRAALDRTQGDGRLLGAGMIALGIGACVAGYHALALARDITTIASGH